MKQFVFTYDDVKFVTLIGAGSYLSKAKVTPTANVGKYQDLSTAGFQKAFRNDFGQTLLSVPVITSMSHCSCTNEGIFTIHGRYLGTDGKEHSVDIMPDRTVDSADHSEEVKPVVESEVYEAEATQSTPEQPQRIVASAPSATMSTPPVTPMQNEQPVAEPVKVEGEIVGMTLGRKKKKKKKGISFGQVDVGHTYSESQEMREAERRLGVFPVRQEPEPKVVPQVPQVNEPVVEKVFEDMQVTADTTGVAGVMKKISSGQSALEALSTFRDSSLVSLPQDKIDILKIIPLDILHMSDKFVTRRAGINFDILKEDGEDYCRANKWQSCEGWWCIDILETAERIFYNSVDGSVYEFDAVVCKDMYIQRTEASA